MSMQSQVIEVSDEQLNAELEAAQQAAGFQQLQAHIAAVDEVAAYARAKGYADIAEMLDHSRMNTRIAQLLATQNN